MSNLKTNIIFGTPFFKTNIENKKLIKELISYIEKEKNKSKGRTISNQGGWQSNDLNLKDQPIKNLFSWINIYLTDFYTAYEFYRKKIIINNVWANINNYKDCNQLHNHVSNNSPDFSSVFYLKVKSGKIKFINPDPFIRYMPLLNKAIPKFYNLCNSYEYFVEPKPGDLLIFPSTINHLVEPNMDKESRISLAFNWSVE